MRRFAAAFALLLFVTPAFAGLPVDAKMGVAEVMGAPFPTQKLTSSDSAQLLPTVFMAAWTGASGATQIVDSYGNVARAVLITCETNDIRFAAGGQTPTQAGVGHVLAAGSSLRLSGKAMVDSFRFISKTGASAGVLQITPEM